MPALEANMKRYSINKKIMLSFLDHFMSSDAFFDEKDNACVLIDGQNVYLELPTGKYETNNTVGSMDVYIRDGSLKEIL